MATKKLKKYMITNITDNTNIGRLLTKKATLEWLEEQYLKMDEKSNLDFATCVYGKEFPNLGFHSSVISHANKIAIEERLPKMLKKELIINNKTYVIKEDSE